MTIFMDEIICMTTGGDMDEAYAALWELPLIWSIISCEIKTGLCLPHTKRICLPQSLNDGGRVYLIYFADLSHGAKVPTTELTRLSF